MGVLVDHTWENQSSELEQAHPRKVRFQPFRDPLLNGVEGVWWGAGSLRRRELLCEVHLAYQVRAGAQLPT